MVLRRRMCCTSCCSIVGFEDIQRSSSNADLRKHLSSFFFTRKVSCFNTGLKLSIIDVHSEPLNPVML